MVLAGLLAASTTFSAALSPSVARREVRLYLADLLTPVDCAIAVATALPSVASTRLAVASTPRVRVLREGECEEIAGLPRFSLSVSCPYADRRVDPAARLPAGAALVDSDDAAVALLVCCPAAPNGELTAPAVATPSSAFNAIGPNGDLPGATLTAAGELGAPVSDSRASASGCDVDSRPLASVAASALSLLAVATETVFTGDDPSGSVMALRASRDGLRRRAFSSPGKTRGGDEISSPAPPNLMGGGDVLFLTELDEDGVPPELNAAARSRTAGGVVLVRKERGDRAGSGATFFFAAAAGGRGVVEARLGAVFLVTTADDPVAGRGVSAAAGKAAGGRAGRGC